MTAMAGPPTLEHATAEIGATLVRLGALESDLGAVEATIGRSPRGPGQPVELPAISVDRSDDATTAKFSSGGQQSDLVAHHELGRGGMGVVHLALQRSLGREVAVKTSVTNKPSVARALVREAQIMGGLEHPNVVPVHALGLDPDGLPVLVMKRIEGVSLRSLLNDPDHLAWRPLLVGHGDRLRAHVEILLQVTRALAFAHQHGVVHRDLKPENVMIGHFGEVYLLDWGVALRLSEREAEPHGIVGTPGYMAPEMTSGNPLAVDSRTDVFLLGANLYEVLTGRLPNAASSASAALIVALTGSRPPMPASVPAELRTLVEAAMALDPAARLPSAEAFREGLARVLASHEVDSLVREASRSRAVADEAIAVEGAVSPRAYPALIEARFALMSAARVRPDDARVRADLDSCLLLLANRDVALRSPIGARAHLIQMGVAPAALVADVERLEKELEEERRLADAGRQKAADADVSLSWVTLSLAVVSVPALTIGIWLLQMPAVEGFRGPAKLLWAEGCSLLVFLGIAVLLRRRILWNAASRRLTAFFILWGWYPGLVGLVHLLRGDATYDHVLGAVIGLCLGTLGTLTLLPELWPTIVTHLVGIGVMLAWPEHRGMVSFLQLVGSVPVVIRALWLSGRRTRAPLAPGAVESGRPQRFFR
jgi:hypothetical protein